ncbi:60S ribosomal protein L6 [Entomophthora muscae]|uniref:60S ribosomal protein L6 n=1 Tax=Entomophthora muscae TaxID=34485 RepID=A0ACC2T358_9FUNG|nr:60S ribosomal protein L6 [Entomophthora muscae]
MVTASIHQNKNAPIKLRNTIKPGSVLILLAGLHKGKRVICLKQLDSGLILISGPYTVNGVPLRRVNQSYVIATDTRIDISSIQVPEHINDAYFAKAKGAKKGGQTIEEFFGDNKGKKTLPISAERKADQKTIDSALLPIIKKKKSS